MIERHPFFWRAAAFVLFMGVLIGCNAPPPVAETPPPPVTVSQPVTRELIDHDDYEGHIGAVDTVDVRARVRGHLVKVSFEDGQMVKKGDLLYEIDPRPYQAKLDAAQAQKAAAEAALDLAKKEYDRTKALVRAKAASLEEMDVWTGKQAVAAADRLKALASVEEAQLDLDFTKITAEKAGKISRNQVSVGNLINTVGGETLLTTIVTVDPMYVYFNVDERALLNYRRQFGKAEDPDKSVKDLKIPVLVALDGDVGFPHKGMIDFSDNRVNPSTGTIELRGALPNPGRILDAGMHARVRVPVSDPHKAILVTERAIGTEQGRKFVYVVNDANVVERRDVTLGRVSDGLQVIQEGLKPTDRVIVNGIQRVRAGIKVEPQQGPMPGVKPSEPKA